MPAYEEPPVLPGGSFLQGFQNFFQLGNAFDLIIRNDFTTGLMVRVNPDGPHASVFAAQNVRGETVSHHDRLIRVKAGNLCIAGIKIFSGGFVVPQLLRNGGLHRP